MICEEEEDLGICLRARCARRYGQDRELDGHGMDGHMRSER